jgi:hypothetical protein
MPGMLIYKNINSRFIYLSISLIAVMALVIVNKSLWFFDEDVFVTNLNSTFMQQGWQRAYLVKQFFKMQHYFFGKSPAGYHIISALLHAVNALLATTIFKMFCKQLRVLPAALDLQNASYVFLMLFLITPVHSEPLCYILAQGVLLFSFFTLLSIFYFIKTITVNKKWLPLSILFFILSLLCYEISWIFPVITLTLLFCINIVSQRRILKNAWICLLYFLVLGSWLFIKAIFISKTLVADYEGMSFANMDVLQLLRNAVVLFIRNFLPPFKNTGVFITAGVILSFLLIAGIYYIIKRHKEMLTFFACLFLLTVFAFLPTALFGIDSHDSESERYVYFSSVFSIMLITAFLFIMLKTDAVRKFFFAAVFFMFGWVLFATMNFYKQAGNFSKEYSSALAKQINGVKKVYTINQPSQFKGALILRALSRLSYTTENNHTIINEHMRYLCNINVQAEIITVSIKEPALPYKTSLNTTFKPADSCLYYFPEAASLFAQQNFDKTNSIVAALHNNDLYIFR